MNAVKTALAVSLVSASLLTATPAHAQTPRCGLSPQAAQIFMRAMPSVKICAADTAALTGDIQATVTNMQSGSTDTGTMQPDANQMLKDCLYAALTVNGLRFGRNMPIARHIQGELYTALIDDAHAAYDVSSAAAYLASGDYRDAVSALQDGDAALRAGLPHINVARRYLRF
jgi:hypothetical protein